MIKPSEAITALSATANSAVRSSSIRYGTGMELRTSIDIVSCCDSVAGNAIVVSMVSEARMKIKIEIDLTAEWDRELIEHMAECPVHQMGLFQRIQFGMAEAMSRAYHLRRDTLSFTIGIPEQNDHSMMVIDDLSDDERKRYDSIVQLLRDTENAHVSAA